MQRSFHVQAVWDEQEKVWFSESDITGLHIEAETLKEFYDLVNEFASDLIVSNHYSDSDLSGASLRDLIPAVVITQKDEQSKVA